MVKSTNVKVPVKGISLVPNDFDSILDFGGKSDLQGHINVIELTNKEMEQTEKQGDKCHEGKRQTRCQVIQHSLIQGAICSS